MEVPAALARLSFTRLRLGYKVLERAAFPADKRPLFRRGLIGDLREASCHEAPGVCPVPAGVLPFVFSPPDDDRTRLFPGDALWASLVLVGRAAAHAACYVHALDRHVRRGLGPDRCRILLEQVEFLDPRDRRWTQFYFSKDQLIRSTPVAFDAPQIAERAALLIGRPRITLHLTSPLRLLPEKTPLTAEALLGALHARVARLAARWCDGTSDAAPASTVGITLLDAPLDTRVRSRRTTQRQGTLTLAGPLDAWFPLLVAGQHLHVGVGAAMGFGRYELRP